MLVEPATRPDASSTSRTAPTGGRRRSRPRHAQPGARVVDGLEVLVRQGAASFERWTGLPAPVDVMRGAQYALPR